MNQFVHLHTHTHYSLCDATPTVKKLVNKAKFLGMPAIAVTDHGNLFGAIEFYHEAKKNNIKPIIGCELYISTSRHSERFIQSGKKNYHHLIVLAKNNEGYRNLIKLASTAYTDGFYYKPRVDKETLKEHSNGLIALTACLGGEIPQAIMNNDEQLASYAIHEFVETFGKDHFFLELQNHGIEKQKIVNDGLIALSKKLNIPLIATNDVHYMNQDDYEAHDILLCIGGQKKVSEGNRKKYFGDQFYFKSYDEMEKLFSHVPEALQNTLYVADMCSIDLKFNPSLPDFKIPSGYTTDGYLRHLCEEGTTKRYSEITDDIQKRLDYELEIITKMGFTGYFLIVWDFIRYAKSQNIMVGPGRGSAAGSLVAYSLGITDLDPLKYHLLFERFLNPERISMPDIDIDFQDDKRDQVIQYVIDSYGKDKVASIITFGALKARAVIRDVGRVLDIPLKEVDTLAKLIPGGPNTSLDTAYNDIPDLKNLIDSNPIYQKLFILAKKLEGTNRHAGTHAAGIVIGYETLSNIVPLYADPKTKSISTQFEGQYLEEVGLLKMDFLGLKNLSVIQKCLELIEATHGKVLDINNIPLDDKKSYNLLKKGRSLGLFQLESSGMQELMVKLKPMSFEDIVALIALYRPGPLNSGMAEEFIKRKNNPGKIRYEHPLLKNVLKETYGVIVYQEQVMEIARAIGGFSMAKADELRKAMGKKNAEKMNAMKEEFVSGAISNKIDKNLAENLYDQMAKFGEYGFNKSHSAAYSMITYQTAYLKANYPIEYMASLLSCDKDNTDKIVEYVNESKSMGINILGPSVNKSMIDFSVEQNDIRFGLSAIKNVGSTAVQSILKSRIEFGEFKSLSDCCEKVDLRVVNKKVLECLIKSGACDCFQLNRATHLSIIDKTLEYAQSIKADKESGQFSLFGEEKSTSVRQNIVIHPHEELNKKTKLLYEKEVLGFYLSGHPLQKYQDKISKLKLNYISTLKDFEEGSPVLICGLIQDVSFKVSKKGTEYATALVEGLKGSCEVLFFKECYSQTKSILNLDSILIISGKLDSTEPRIKIIAEKTFPIDEVNDESILLNIQKENKPILKKNITPPKKQSLNISLTKSAIEDNNFKDIEKLKNLVSHHKGKSPIYIHFNADPGNNNIMVIKAGEEYCVDLSDQLLNEINSFQFIEKTWIN